MFGNADVIAASRKFVCVRIDTYESEANEELVRKLMDGVLVNTTFCLLAPDGKTTLSHVGRSISGPFASPRGLSRISRRYAPAGDADKALVPDFHSVRSALNVASADGRLLVLIVAQEEKVADIETALRSIAWHDDVAGRFHFDLETDPSTFQDKLDGKVTSGPGIYVVQADSFGLRGEVLKRMDVDADAEAIRESLLAANEQFARTAKPKTYESHVAEGKRKGIYLEMAIPYGEDRDADGKIDADHAKRFERARARARRSGNLVPTE